MQEEKRAWDGGGIGGHCGLAVAGCAVCGGGVFCGYGGQRGPDLLKVRFPVAWIRAPPGVPCP